LEFFYLEPVSPSPSSALNLVNTQQVFKKIIHLQHKFATIKMIQKRVGEHFGVFPPDLKLRSRSKAIVFSRQVAMYLVKRLTSASLPKIGREFGGKHHTTVLSSIKKIEAQRRTDIDLNRTIGELFDSLRQQDHKPPICGFPHIETSVARTSPQTARWAHQRAI
jgi:chromosomal replication initiation ATPase DnaA